MQPKDGIDYGAAFEKLKNAINEAEQIREDKEEKEGVAQSMAFAYLHLKHKATALLITCTSDYDDLPKYLFQSPGLPAK